MWIYANPNPCRSEEPDCVIRAISLATGQSWHETFWDLCQMAAEKCTMPSTNWLWGLYLQRKGFAQFLLPESCPLCLTVHDFCREFPRGTFVIGTGSHAICIHNGNWLDSWDSGGEVPTYFFKKMEG